MCILKSPLFISIFSLFCCIRMKLFSFKVYLVGLLVKNHANSSLKFIFCHFMPGIAYLRIDGLKLLPIVLGLSGSIFHSSKMLRSLPLLTHWRISSCVSSFFGSLPHPTPTLDEDASQLFKIVCTHVDLNFILYCFSILVSFLSRFLVFSSKQQQLYKAYFSIG